MLTASKNLWDRFTDKARRRAFRRTHVGSFLALQIFKIRNDRELSQSKLAKMIGSTQPQISDWEGSCETVSLQTLHKLADAFDVALSVKFVPYSELVREALIVPADRPVPAFDDDSPAAVSFGSVRVFPPQMRNRTLLLTNGPSGYLGARPQVGSNSTSIALRV